MRNRQRQISTLATHLIMGLALAMLTGCGGPLSAEKPLRREKISDGVSRKIIVEDRFAWTQSFTRISAETPDGQQRFRVQIRSKQDSILWAAISDDLIGLRVGKAIVINDSAAFSSTLLGVEWTGSANDLAGVTGIEVPFQYLNRLLRGQLIGTNEAMRYRYDGNGDHWVTQYAISRGRAVTVALDRDLHMSYVLIEDPLESVFIQYKSVDEETGYPTEITITVKSQPDYKVTIEVTEIRTGGPFNTPFSL
ncbi:MAG: DUF4292 domain-containing protein [Flavobacteriaceae bacterium]|nr:DUF4292 domain-containing protein [Flavobacteriaceae bacterium]